MAGVIAYPLVFIANRVLPLSVFPKVPLIFQTPELNVTFVSDDGAEAGSPVSKFSVIVVCANTKPENIKPVINGKILFIRIFLR